jgi:hypothetical protein
VSHFNRNVDRNCDFCNIAQNPDPEDETILHLFFNCTIVEPIRERFFRGLIGRDLSRQEFFGEPRFDNFCKNKILKVCSCLIMFFLWESKKRYCVPSFALLDQFIKTEIKTMSICSNNFQNLLTKSGLNF